MFRSILSSVIASTLALSGLAQADSFTYRGYLEDGGSPAQGLYDLRLTMHAGAKDNLPLAQPIDLYSVMLEDGRFAVELDLPGLPKNLDNGWLEVAVRSPGDGAYTALPTRAEIALRGTACPASWELTGNAGTDPAVNFLGTLDNTPVVIKPALRLQSRQVNSSPSIFFRNSNGDGNARIAGLDDMSYHADSHHWATTSGQSAVPRMVVANNGNVGIGTHFDDPQTKLHVQGERLLVDGTGVAGSEGTNALIDIRAAGESTMIPTVRFAHADTLRARIDAFSDTLVVRSEGRLALRVGGNTTRFLMDEAGLLALNRGPNAPVPGFAIHVGNNTSNGNGAHLLGGGLWVNGSSRSFKHEFEAVDPQDVLNRLLDLPITRWSYLSEEGTRHMGPVAEEFRAAFGLGNDEKYIGTADADGVALAAIQGLNAKLEASNAQLRAELVALRQQHDHQLAALRSELATGTDAMRAELAAIKRTQDEELMLLRAELALLRGDAATVAQAGGH